MSDVVQVVMLDALREQFEVWLNSRGLELVKAPVSTDDPDEIPTFIVIVGQELWREFQTRPPET